MSRAGYETWHCGKGDNEYTTGLVAFDTNILMNDHSANPRRGSSERHADAAIKFLQERKADKPFYIYLAPPVPHDPRLAAPEFHGMYRAKNIPLPPAFMPLHPFDNGEMTVRDEKLAPWPRTPEDTKQQLADYYACITGLDHHLGRIFAELKKVVSGRILSSSSLATMGCLSASTGCSENKTSMSSAACMCRVSSLDQAYRKARARRSFT